MDVWRRLADEHAQAMLPCPHCAAGVRGANLAKHVQDKHGGGAAGWPARLTLDRDRLSFKTLFGLRTRAVDLPAPIGLGGLVKTRGDAMMSSYADDYPGLAGSVTSRAGVYLDVGGLRIGCPISTDARKHWTGWQQADKAGRAHITLDPPGFVALQYALAERGALTPRAT